MNFVKNCMAAKEQVEKNNAKNGIRHYSDERKADRSI